MEVRAAILQRQDSCLSLVELPTYVQQAGGDLQISVGGASQRAERGGVAARMTARPSTTASLLERRIRCLATSYLVSCLTIVGTAEIGLV